MVDIKLGSDWGSSHDQEGQGSYWGGSWNNNNAQNLRSSNRNRNNPNNRNNNIGFRCASTPAWRLKLLFKTVSTTGPEFSWLCATQSVPVVSPGRCSCVGWSMTNNQISSSPGIWLVGFPKVYSRTL